MLCLAPIHMQHNKFNYDVPCRQCLPCRLNKQREWTGRILLESKSHEHNTFVTMTYDEENVQVITKREMQLWQKKFRKELDRRTGETCRFYTIGEYGTRTARPHYHAIIFGPDPRIAEAILQQTWSKGFVKASSMLPTHASYVARYSTKKLARSWTPKNHPEFVIMSKKPPMGTEYFNQIISTLKNRLTRGQISENDILENVNRIKLSGQLYPLSQIFKERLISQLEINYRPYLGKLIGKHFGLKETWKTMEGINSIALKRSISSQKATNIQLNYRETI